MKNKEKGFVQGALILIIFGLLSKIIGAVYRLPLTSIITAEGMGLYQMVFPVYTLMLTISSSGLPSSISKLISENISQRKFRQADKILKVSFIILIIFSLVCAILVFVLSGTIAKLQGNENAKICYLGIAPAIVFVGMIAGFRGYFQGQENMMPSAVSGLIEQLIKLLLGLYFAQKLLKFGISYAVFGAMLGITASEFIAFIYLLLNFLIFRKRHQYVLLENEKMINNKTALKMVLSTSFFVTLGALIMPLGMMVDSALIVNILKSVGYDESSATALFGLQSGTVGSIVNMPVVVSLSIATAILPRVSSKKAKSDIVGMKKDIGKAILLTIMFALPASFGCLGLAEPILKILYRRSLIEEEILVAVKLLQVASAGIFCLALLQVTNGILQGIGLVCVPLISLGVGMILKIILDLILVRLSSVGILGAEIASVLCYLVALVINMVVLKIQNVLKFEPKVLLLVLFSVGAYFSKYLFHVLVKTNLNYFLSFFMTVFVVVIVYFILIFMIYKKEFFKRKS